MSANDNGDEPTNVVSIVGLMNEADAGCQAVVDVLSDLLKRARRGEIRAVAVASVFADGSFGTDITQNSCVSSLLGTVAALQFTIAANIVRV